MARKKVSSAPKTNVHEPIAPKLNKQNWFTKTPAEISQQHKFSPNQEAGLEQLLQQGLGSAQHLQLPGSPLQSESGQYSFAPIAQSARENFSQNTVPSLAERFSSLGSGANLTSGVFQNQLANAGAGLESEIARLASEYGLQQQHLNLQERAQQSQNLGSLLGAGLSPRTDPLYQPEQQSKLLSFGKGLGNAAVQLGSSLLGGGGGGNAFGSQKAPVQNIGAQGQSGNVSGLPNLGVQAQGGGFASGSQPYSSLQNYNQKVQQSNGAFTPQSGYGQYKDIINLLANR